MQANELNNILTELRDFIRMRFKVPSDDPDFTDDVNLFDYGYVDSFGAVELINFVKEKFAIEITESDLIAYPMNTIRQITQFIVKRRAEQQ
jgi:methoxymalonate biosynthesis acyl carrier protein